MPHLSADLRPSSTQLLWITDIYGFLIAGSLITMGTLGDRIGRRRLLLIGAAAFGVAAVLTTYSTSAEMLIASRATRHLRGYPDALHRRDFLTLFASGLFLAADPALWRWSIGLTSFATSPTC